MVTTLATSLLVITIGNISFEGTKEYKAQFVDATGVVKGDDIRIAGVKVGTVKKVEIVDETQALVTFTVEKDTQLNASTHASIRYRNLVGQRYISLTQDAGETDVLKEDGTRSRSRAPRPPSTSPSCSTGSSRSSRRSRPTTSTSCPTRSSRSSRARAAPSRTSSATPPRSRRRWPTATRDR